MADIGGFVWFLRCFLLISLLIFQFSHAEETSGIIGDCKKSCEKSYPLHTYPKEEPVQACKQGCRLSAIEQHADRVNATESCITGCQESYEDSESVYACYMGCKSQGHVTPFMSSVEDVMPDQWSMKSYMLYIYPVLDVGKYCTGFMNRASDYYQMSVGYYYSSDGNSVVVEVNQIPRAYADFSSLDVDVSEGDEPQYYDVTYTGLTDDDSSYSYGVVSKGHRWLQCVSRRSGLPMWFLTSTLFLSLFFLMWLCCATVSTTPKEKPRKPAVVSELLYLDENSLLEKLPLVQVEEENDEAGPLPVKVHIDSTSL